MQARRRAQPSGTNSPSSSHPRLKHRARCAIFFRARHAAARVAPERGLRQARILEPRGSAPRERDHRGGDHPVPSRTRQLSPPSPRVLQRQAAGGQGVALAEGAFLSAPKKARRGCPLRAFPRLGRVLAWSPFSPDAAILVSRYRRPIRALEALARSALCGFLSRARRLLTARAAIHLPCGVGDWPPDRPSVAHGGSPCGISLQFDDAAAGVWSGFAGGRVRDSRLGACVSPAQGPQGGAPCRSFHVIWLRLRAGPARRAPVRLELASLIVGWFGCGSL